jgi:hypothetical protein
VQAHGANAEFRFEEWSIPVPRSNPRLALLAAYKRPEASKARTQLGSKQKGLWGTNYDVDILRK